MSNSFNNQPWNQYPAGYNPSFLQLEEHDFSPPGGNQQQLPQPMYSANQYYQQNPILPNPAASSSLQGAFDAPIQQQPRTRTSGFTSSQADVNGNPFANVFAGNSHQASAQDPTTVSRFRNPTNSFRFSSNTAPAPLSLPISSTDNVADVNYLSSSPGSMHDTTFNSPPVPTQQKYHHSSNQPNLNKGTSLPQAKRPRKQVFSDGDDGRDDDQDAEMSLDQKEGTKVKS